MSVFEKAGRVFRNASTKADSATSLLGALFFLFVFLAPLRAETTFNVPTAPESDVTIRLATPWMQNPRFGFAPVRVSIENRAGVERTWHVEFQAGMRNYSLGVLTSGQDIEVPAGQTRDVWVFAPIAEPGVNTGISGATFSPFTGAGSPGASSTVNVKIVDTPTGKKATRTRTMSTGAVYVTETEVNVKTGVITTTNISPEGTRNDTRLIPLARGTAVTFTIEPSNGLIIPRTRKIPGSTAPAVVDIVVPGSPARRPPAGPLAAAPAAYLPMMLFADVSGPGVAGTTRINFPASVSPNGMRPFAVSALLEGELRTKLSAILSGAPNLSVIDPAQLPADWRAWSSFSGVVLTRDEYAGLDAGRRSALRGWVALGGQLCLSPAIGRTAVKNGQIENLGAGTIMTLAEPLDETKLAAAAGSDETPLAETAEKVQTRRAIREGAAGSAVGSKRNPTAAEAASVIKNVQFFGNTAGLPDQAALALDKNGPLYELVEEVNDTNAWLAMFLIAFAVVVGPLNLFLFAPPHRRHRLFLTTPLIALAASIILGITILVQDGIGGLGARRALVVLLPGENQAAVFQEQAARTGFLPRRTFPLASDIQLTSLPLAEPSYRGSETTYTRGNDAAGGDWFRSRALQAHLLQRLVSTRSRIEQVGTATNGAPIVQSSLGTTLRDFVLVGPDGQLWKTGELPSGKRVTLERGGIWLGDKSGPQLPGGSARFKQVFDAAAVNLPGRWSALGGATELAPIATLKSVTWKAGDVVYLGSLEGDVPASSPGPAAKTEGPP